MVIQLLLLCVRILQLLCLAFPNLSLMSTRTFQEDYSEDCGIGWLLEA